MSSPHLGFAPKLSPRRREEPRSSLRNHLRSPANSRTSQRPATESTFLLVSWNFSFRWVGSIHGHARLAPASRNPFHWCHACAPTRHFYHTAAHAVPNCRSKIKVPESHKYETNLGHTQRLPESLTRRVHSAAAKSPLRAFGGEHRPQFGSTSTC